MRKNVYVAAAMLAVGVSVLGAGGVANADDADAPATRAGNDCSWYLVSFEGTFKLGVECRSLEDGFEARATKRARSAVGPIISETPWLQSAPGTALSASYGPVDGYVLGVEYRRIGG